jgi:hypothetical protein
MFPQRPFPHVTLFTWLNGFFKVFGQIWDAEATDLDLGMDLLHSIKELGLNISRTSLDFLLSACAKAKNSQLAQKIWMEYEYAGLPQCADFLEVEFVISHINPRLLKTFFHHMVHLWILPPKEQLRLLLANSIPFFVARGSSLC